MPAIPFSSRQTAVFALGSAMVAAVVLSAPAAIAEQRAAPFTIKTSLDGRTVLPHRIQWLAYPSAPVHFPGVEFLIDGKVVFANRLEPFAFGADGRDEASKSVRTGYLVTSWLSPGRHTFTVRASRAPDRARAAKKAVARVLPAPAPPEALAGTWTRAIPSPVPADRNVLYRGTAPAGEYRITVDRRYIRTAGPVRGAHVKNDFVARPTTLTIASPVWTGEPNERAWCDPWGPEATYSWSVSGDALSLTPTAAGDACKQRGEILTGEWTRVK